MEKTLVEAGLFYDWVKRLVKSPGTRRRISGELLRKTTHDESR